VSAASDKSVDLVIKEDLGAIVTTLRYVMWIAGSDDPCDSWHRFDDAAEKK